jgi:hypothetical protein
MQIDDHPNRSPKTGLRVVVAVLVILLISAGAVAVVQRNRLADEIARSDRLAERLAESRERIAELEGESEPDDTDPPPNGTGDDNPFDDVFGGDIGALLECVGTPTSPAEEDSAEDARGQLDEISAAVEQLRGLRFNHEVDAQFLAPEAVAAKAARITLRDYPRTVADAEGRMLEALGAIPQGTDLRSMTRELIRSQVAGFYVPKSDELVVPGSPDEPLGPAEKVILAHELTHAVTDGRLKIPLPDHPDPADLDEDLAALAVVEGDATLLMQRYAIAHLSVFDQLSLTNDPAYQASQEAIKEIPPYLVQQLTYPYVDGLNFTCELYAKGGWEAVNAAYKNPPTTTAQVLFPERYEHVEAAREPSGPRSPHGPWKRVWRSSFGAANLLWLFEAPGGDESAALDDLESRVGDWAGGTIHVWSRGPDTALALMLSERRGGNLCATIAEWYDASFDDDSDAPAKTSEEAAFDGGSQSAIITCSGSEVHLGVGPDLQTARGLVRR